MSASKRLVSPMIQQNEVVAKKVKPPNNSSNGHKVNETSGVESFDYLFDEDDIDIAQLVDVTKPKIELNLSTWQRCVVTTVERQKRTFDLVLTVSSDADRPKDQQEDNDESATAKCHLQGPWSQTQVNAGDLVSLQAKWDNQLGAFKVDKDIGYCVTQPDMLISSTNVVGALFCRRKAVLQDRFKGIDANSKVMVIGSLVHELLQTVLTTGLKTYQEIADAAAQLLNSVKTAHMLFESLLTPEEVAHEVAQFVPNIVMFVAQYVQGKQIKELHKDSFQDTITEIADIEENIWVPQLGLKGKVDVSVRIKRRRSPAINDQSAVNALPLELKTGRGTFSMEHKGQVTLYQMMLSTMGRATHSGLLLYLREGLMCELQSARNEQRDLIMLRNDYAHYLSQPPAVPALRAQLCLGDGKFMQPLSLPEPISHHSACRNCAYSTICCTFAKTDPELQLHDFNVLREVMQTVTAHLQPEDYEYFIRWCGLIALEEQESKKSHNLHALWTEAAETRKRNGRAVLDLELSGEVRYEDGRYLHAFKQANAEESENEAADLTLCGFTIGEYVIVSSTKRLAIAAGCIYALNKTTIAVSLERNLRKNYASQQFIVDKYDSQSGNTFNYTNLSLLLEGTERAAIMRNIIVRREQPVYGKVLPKVIVTQGASILKTLNSVQRAAVLKALTTESYMLIKGLPGTGKTQTLVAIVRLLHLMGKSVLITSHTHSAVDNLLVRLKAHNLPFLRLGSDARINPSLLEHSESSCLHTCSTVNEITHTYASYSIVGVTCLGAAHALFLHRQFDYCIVDEATQVMQPTVLRPLFYCSRFILVGDPEQLPPLIRSPEARQRGADESLFQRLDSPTATAVLTLQYRMNKTITRVANELTYKGALQCASNDISLATLKLAPMPASLSPEKWLQRALQTHIDQAVFLLDTKDCAERSTAFAMAKHSRICTTIEQSFAETDMGDKKRKPLSTPSKQQRRQRISKYTNYCEAAVIFHLLRALLTAGYPADRIGIVAPYRAQVELLRKLTAQFTAYYKNQKQSDLPFDAVEVNTVDQYQGRDKDILLYSCARTGNLDEQERPRNAEILEDKRRLTVAITRAKYKLLLVGDATSLQQYSPFRALLEHIPSYCKLSLEDDKFGFKWSQLLDDLAMIING